MEENDELDKDPQIDEENEPVAGRESRSIVIRKIKGHCKLMYVQE